MQRVQVYPLPGVVWGQETGAHKLINNLEKTSAKSCLMSIFVRN